MIHVLQHVRSRRVAALKPGGERLCCSIKATWDVGVGKSVHVWENYGCGCVEKSPNPPPSNSLISFLKVPVMSIFNSPCSLPHPSPFHRSPNVSVPHCFVLPSLAPLVSCPPCCAFCVGSRTGLDNVYKNNFLMCGCERMSISPVRVHS